MGKAIKTLDDFFRAGINPFNSQPHAWIQWKGTQVCMDVHCSCGELTHIDADFTYAIKCGACGRVYACNGNIQLVELEIEPNNVVESE